MDKIFIKLYLNTKYFICITLQRIIRIKFQINYGEKLVLETYNIIMLLET